MAKSKTAPKKAPAKAKSSNTAVALLAALGAAVEEGLVTSDSIVAYFSNEKPAGKGKKGKKVADEDEDEEEDEDEDDEDDEDFDREEAIETLIEAGAITKAKAKKASDEDLKELLADLEDEDEDDEDEDEDDEDDSWDDEDDE